MTKKQGIEKEKTALLKIKELEEIPENEAEFNKTLINSKPVYFVAIKLDDRIFMMNPAMLKV